MYGSKSQEQNIVKPVIKPVTPVNPEVPSKTTTPVRLRSNIQAGKVLMDQKQGWQDNGRHGQMAAGQGGRSTTTSVKFNTPFNYVPKVTLIINALDAAGSSIRINSEVVDVTKERFTAKFSTWADTKIYMVHANWIAA